MEPAMNGTLGFQEVRSATSQSPSNQLVHEQRHQFGTGFWNLFHAHDVNACSTGISTRREWLLAPLFCTSLAPQASVQREGASRHHFQPMSFSNCCT